MLQNHTVKFIRMKHKTQNTSFSKYRQTGVFVQQKTGNLLS